MRRTWIATILAGSLVTAAGQESIVYHSGPLVLDSFYNRMDLDEDGTADYLVEGYFLVNLPSPGYPTTLAPVVDTISLNGGDYLMGPDIYGNILIKPTGYLFGPETVPGEIWSHRELEGQAISLGWSGFEGTPPEGYVGVRFLSGERLHYGWIRFLVPTSESDPRLQHVFPVVAEWAYEARPDTGIRAGDIGSNEEPVWFTVDFRNPDGTLNGSTLWRSTAAFVLGGDTLRYEMTLAGLFTSADVRGPAGSWPRAKTVASLASPYLALPGFTVFFGETRLSRPQANQLRHNQLSVGVNGGAAVGRILRTDDRSRAQHVTGQRGD